MQTRVISATPKGIMAVKNNGPTNAMLCKYYKSKTGTKSGPSVINVPIAAKAPMNWTSVRKVVASLDDCQDGASEDCHVA
jgi:hypothetical protein